jgi:amphiphysin
LYRALDKIVNETGTTNQFRNQDTLQRQSPFPAYKGHIASSITGQIFGKENVASASNSSPVKRPPPPPPPRAQNIAVALFDYTAQCETDVSFRAGDLIAVKEKNESGWWKGTVNGKTGDFPGNYVKMK